MSAVLLRLLVRGAAVFAALNLPYALAQKTSPQDEKFVQDTVKGGMHEVQMGRMAMDRGMSQDVKGFSQRLMNDHSKANQELASLAKQKGITLLPDDAQMVQSMPLAKLRGADFDKEFTKAMVDDHEKDIAAFEREASSGSDPDIKDWARRTLPTLRAHLSEARTLPK